MKSIWAFRHHKIKNPQQQNRRDLIKVSVKHMRIRQSISFHQLQQTPTNDMINDQKKHKRQLYMQPRASHSKIQHQNQTKGQTQDTNECHKLI